MRKIAIALTKGGVGKTTSAVNLAAALALAGNRVLLVDSDTQGQAGRLLGCQPPAGLAELALGEKDAAQVTTPAREGLWLLAGGRALAGLKRLITRQDYGGEQTLAEALVPLDGQYDFVLLDTAPGWDALTINVLFYAREVLAPVSLEVLSLQGLTEFARSITSLQKYAPHLAIRYVLPTFYDRRVKKSAEILEQLRLHYPEQVCDPVRYSVRLSEAPGYGQTIFEYAPASSGAEDYRRLAARVLETGASS